MTRRVRRFTLRAFFATVTLVACCAGIARACGLVVGSFVVMLVLCYALASFLSLRARLICAACSALFALLPWLGVGDGAFYAAGVNDRLPVISLPEGITFPFTTTYQVAAIPLHLAADLGGPRFREVIFFNGGPAAIRPFIVFQFWLALALMFGLSAAFSRAARCPDSNQFRSN